MKDLILEANVAFADDIGVTTCALKDVKNNIFIGEAHCHPDDMDMMNRLTGSEIAYRRAYIKFLKHMRDTEFVPQLSILKHMYSCMEQAADFNPKDNNIRLMKRSIDNYSAAVDMIRAAIRDERNDLHTYMTDKAKLYKLIRDRRTSNTAKNN